MSKRERIIEQGAERLTDAATKAATRGGLVGKLAQPLAEDSAFARKLKPRLVTARAEGEVPGWATPAHEPEEGAGERDPLVWIGVALGAGMATAKFLDWRGHAHPRG